MIKKFYAGLTAVALLATVVSMSTQDALAVSANDTTDVNLEITATISASCDASITMNAIAGTGQSTLDAANDVNCTFTTNNTGGYQVTLAATAADMSAGGSDDIEEYTEAVADTTETWSVAGTDGEWGYRLKSTSEVFEADETTQWAGTDTYAGGLWLGVGIAGTYVAFDVTSPSTAAGDDQIFQFGAEIGSTKIQPTGTYDQDVVFTATTL